VVVLCKHETKLFLAIYQVHCFNGKAQLQQAFKCHTSAHLLTIPLLCAHSPTSLAGSAQPPPPLPHSRMRAALPPPRPRSICTSTLPMVLAVPTRAQAPVEDKAISTRRPTGVGRGNKGEISKGRGSTMSATTFSKPPPHTYHAPRLP
jgi:hypothetical protein